MSENSVNNNWQCECGRVNTGKFCAACGMSKPVQTAQTAPAESTPKPPAPPKTMFGLASMIAGIFAGILLLISDSAPFFVAGLSLCISPFAMMIGGFSPDDLVMICLITLISAVGMAAGFLIIIAGIVSRVAKTWTAKKRKVMRIVACIISFIGNIGAFPSILWLYRMESGSNVPFLLVFPVLSLILTVAMLVLTLLDKATNKV